MKQRRAYNKLPPIVALQRVNGCDPRVLAGKSVIWGHENSSGISFLGLLEKGWLESEILQNYPRSTNDDILACLSHATALIKSANQGRRKAFDATVGRR
jgi:uncharacterized protein (DUF433 family)